MENMILDYGGSQDKWGLRTAFLERDPDIRANLRDVGANPGGGKDDVKE